MNRVDRFNAKVDRTGDCWLWQGRLYSGYGYFGGTKVHRWSYEHHVGPIPDGLTIDHLCRVRNCVNPDHLEPVTGTENVLRGNGWGALNARKTHCPKGHPYDEENTYLRAGRWRVCRTCQRIHRRECERRIRQREREARRG